MNDQYISTDPFFVAAMMTIYGDDCLLTIQTETQPHRPNEVRFELSVPSFDAAEYLKEFRAGKLAIADLLSYVKNYSQITNTLRQLRRDGDDEWTSPSWIAGRGR